MSLDWLIGDVADKPQNLRALESLSLKAMILASSRPLDSIGLGLGYRLPTFGALGFDLSDFHVFGGYFWTKQDAIESGAVAINGSTTHAWRFGVTYDVTTGLNWLKF